MAILHAEIDPSKAVSGARVVQRSLESISQSAAGMEGKLSGIGSRLNMLLASIGAGFSLKAVIDNTVEAEQSVKRLETVLRSTGGVSGKTSEELQDLASEMQNLTTYGDDAVMQMQALLLTFKNVQGEVFDEAVMAVLDLSAAMGQDLKSSAIMIGKALNDPILGLTTLRRVGIQMSDDQQKVIQALVETGKAAEAQGIILKELESQFGGMARGMRDTLGGAIKGFVNAFGDLLEMNQVNNASKLRIEIEKLTAALQTDEAREFADIFGAALVRGAGVAVDALQILTENIGIVKLALEGLIAVKIVDWLVAFSAHINPVVAALGSMTLLLRNMDFSAAGIETLSERRGLGDNKSGLSKKIAEERDRQAALLREAIDAENVDAILAGARNSGGLLGSSGIGGGEPERKVEDALDRIRDAVHYLNVEGALFIPILEKWKNSLKPLSDEWKKIVDLQRELTQDAAVVEEDNSVEGRIEKLKDAVSKMYSDGRQWSMKIIDDNDLLKVVQFTDGIRELNEIVYKDSGRTQGHITDWMGLGAGKDSPILKELLGDKKTGYASITDGDKSLSMLDGKISKSMQALPEAGLKAGEETGKAIHDGLLKWFDQAVQEIEGKMSKLRPSFGSISDGTRSVTIAGRGQ